MSKLPEWIVPIAGGPAATIRIEDGRAAPTVVLNVEDVLGGELSPMEAAQLGQALQDASRVAAQLGTKRRKRA